MSRPRQWDFMLRRAHTLVVAGRSRTEQAQELGISRNYLMREFRRLSLPLPPVSKFTEHANWTVQGPHEHILHEGMCLLCDRRIQ